MSVYIASDECNEDTVIAAEEVLKLLGETVRVTKENYLDMATAVSGSGPAVSMRYLCIGWYIYVYIGWYGIYRVVWQ